MSSRIPSYKSTLDRFIFVDMKVRTAFYRLIGKLSRASTKLGYTLCEMLLVVKFKINGYFTIL